MGNDPAMRFVNQLARELSAGRITLPSLPDVVHRISELLDEETCDFSQVKQAVQADAMLVSRLFVVANSTAYNPMGQPLESLEAVIGRLGFECVRNTAIALALRQMHLGERHKSLAASLRAIWRRSMQLSALSYSIAEVHEDIDAETAYLCGLVHEIGKVYIVSKCREFPEFLGDPDALECILEEWHAKVGKAILESWDFPQSVCVSADPRSYFKEQSSESPSYADVTFVAERLLAAETDGTPNFATMPSSVRLGITDEVAARVLERYRVKLAEVREALAGS